MALLEAMASGLPCIVTDVGGIGDVVTTARDEPCALMVPKRCPRAIAATVIRLAREPALSDSLGKLARVRAACFSLEAQEQAYSVIYDAMISAARAR
jgi:glycosyltransferase involved in cell wall biosynthesis